MVDGRASGRTSCSEPAQEQFVKPTVFATALPLASTAQQAVPEFAQIQDSTFACPPALWSLESQLLLLVVRVAGSVRAGQDYLGARPSQKRKPRWYPEHGRCPMTESKCDDGSCCAFFIVAKLSAARIQAAECAHTQNFSSVMPPKLQPA
eukprot:SAG31_NODE_11991_length_979_cov_1.634091_2_plen_150_part_00